MNYLPSSLKTVTLSLCIPNQSAKNILQLFSETTDQPNFVCKLLCIRKGDVGHMTKMAVMLIYGKAFENIPSGNRWADFDETWYEASETQAHNILFQ